MKNKKIILLVEDDKLISRAYEASLKNEGFGVFSASDGVEAMAFMNNKAPHLILLDLIMPNKNGFEFLSEVKLNDEWEKIPVIILSNLGQGADVERAKNLGATDYIVKSDSSIQKIIEKVKEYLK